MLPNWLEQGLQNLWQPYTQMYTSPTPLPIVGAKGSRLILADDSELIDGISSWWTVAHGYKHPHLMDAIHNQLNVLPHVMLGGLAHEQAYILATRLAKLLPGSLNHVFFSESGSVSVEVAMKMAIQYWLSRGERRGRFVSFRSGYHGDTIGAMSICDPQEGMHAIFLGIIPEQINTCLPTDASSLAAFEDIISRHSRDIAAVIVEPLVQAAGGMRFHDSYVLRKLRQICDAHRILLIFDEIFVGFGRLGSSLFACEEADVEPDIVTLSKALTGGTLPLAATISSDAVFDSFLSIEPGRALMHGPTYMGNALACAAANASLDLFEREPRLKQATAIGETLRQRLSQVSGLPSVVDVRARGALAVIQFDRAVNWSKFSHRFTQLGVWLRPFGDILYTCPPFVVDDYEISCLAKAMMDVSEEVNEFILSEEE